jgi:hypothetical protein
MSVQKDLKYRINSAGIVLEISRFASILRLAMGDEHKLDEVESIYIDIVDLIDVLAELEVLKDYVNEQHL